MKKLSQGEEAFALHCRAEKIYPERQYKFCSSRKWTFDFAFPIQRVAVEVEGGTWGYGRHNRAGGFEKDCEKYNTATLADWRVLRYTTKMVLDGIAIEEVKRLVI